MSKRLITLGLVLTSCAFAQAELVPVGLPQDGNSWSQAFNETGVGPFDFMGIRMTSTGDSFAAPAFSSLASGWTVDDVSPTVASATGPASTNMSFNIVFEGFSTNPLEFDFVAFLGETVLEAAHASWNGRVWDIVAADPTAFGRSDFMSVAVPVPAAAVLGLLGVSFAGWARRRMA